MSESGEHAAIESHPDADARAADAADDADAARSHPDAAADADDARSDTTAEDPPSIEKQEVPGEAPAPFSAGFFDTDPAGTRARRAYLKMVLPGALAVSVAIWCVLTIYWGALWRTFDLVHNLRGCVVDFDGGDVGAAVTQYMGAIAAKDQLTWAVQPSSMYPNGPADLADAVVQERCWVGIAVNPGASTNLSLAATATDGAYNGSLAVTAYTNEARNENAYSFLILPNVQTPLQTVTAQFALSYAKTLSARENLPAIVSQAPQLLTAPISFTVHNLRPFDIAVAAAVDFVGLIYLLILSFIISGQHFGARLAAGLQRRLALRPLLVLRVVAPLLTYLWVSLMYSLLSLAYLVPFGRTFGRAGFVIYWMMSFCAMSALGLALEVMITLLTMRFVPFFLILWIIWAKANVSVSYYPIEVLPGVFRYGYASPFYNVSRTVRTILFNTKNELGLNFGVQLAWVGVSLITLPLAQAFVRRRDVAQWRKEQAARGGA
ncbi:hypothetical protein HWV62_32882 [Athelia sp. TMB]|nr:hypothetical protein HWV62_32882 [Athelia sp. TMB]